MLKLWHRKEHSLSICSIYVWEKLPVILWTVPYELRLRSWKTKKERIDKETVEGHFLIIRVKMKPLTDIKTSGYSFTCATASIRQTCWNWSSRILWTVKYVLWDRKQRYEVDRWRIKNIIYRCVTFIIDYDHFPKVVCKFCARSFGVQEKSRYKVLVTA